jgi:hypothetical protein
MPMKDTSAVDSLTPSLVMRSRVGFCGMFAGRYHLQRTFHEKYPLGALREFGPRRVVYVEVSEEKSDCPIGHIQRRENLLDVGNGAELALRVVYVSDEVLPLLVCYQDGQGFDFTIAFLAMGHRGRYSKSYPGLRRALAQSSVTPTSVRGYWPLG